MRSLMLIAAIAGAVGCAEQSRYVYTPETQNASTSGLPAAKTPIPQEAPQGSVELASYGVTELGQGDQHLPALHVRMIVTNDGDPTPWRLDTNAQQVQLPNEGRSAPMYVSSNVQLTSSIVTVGPRERRVLDMYFPLPATVSADRQLRGFQVLWQVDTGARTVASSTAFDRVRTEPDVEYAYGYGAGWPYYAGYTPYWWYDPFYPRAVFIHSRPVWVHRGGAVHIGRFSGHYGGHIAIRNHRHR